MGKNVVWGATNDIGDMLRQTKNNSMHGRWRPEVAEKTGDLGDRSDNGKPDKGKAVILGPAPEFQEFESMDKGNYAYMKDDNAVTVGIIFGSVKDNSNEESDPIVREGMSISITVGLDEISTLNSKGGKEY